MLAAAIIIAGICLFVAGTMRLTGACAVARAEQRHRRDADTTRDHDASRLTTQYCQQAEQLAAKRPGWLGWRPLTVYRIVRESVDCKSFYLRDPDGAPLPAFLPGQFLTVAVKNENGTMTSRCYSLSDAPDQRYYRITVKRVCGGAFSPRLHDTVGEGDTLMARAPAGVFVSDSNPQVPLNLIAAGIGITPMISIIDHCQLWQPTRVVQLFYQIRDLEQAPLLEQAARWAAANERVRLYLYVSRPGHSIPKWVAGVGRLNGQEVVRRCELAGGGASSPVLTRGQFMICGPPKMIASLQDELVEQGIDPHRITVEAFGGPSSASPSTPATECEQAPGDNKAGHHVEFAKSGKTFPCSTSHPTILETAEAHGLELESGCRGGDCGACLLRLLKGEVHYPSTPGYAPLGTDEVLACVAQPSGPISVDA